MARIVSLLNNQFCSWKTNNFNCISQKKTACLLVAKSFHNFSLQVAACRMDGKTYSDDFVWSNFCTIGRDNDDAFSSTVFLCWPFVRILAYTALI